MAPRSGGLEKHRRSRASTLTVITRTGVRKTCDRISRSDASVVSTSDMQPFGYVDSPFSVRDDIVQANRTTWQRLAKPGCWWTGEQRVAIAAAVRSAGSCRLCAERKDALSPNAVNGTHDGDGLDALPARAVDAVHRIVTDQSRLSAAWVASLAEDGITDGHYVELLGVVVSVFSIDAFHSALGLLPEPLPEPESGQPSGYRPSGLSEGEAWVSMLGASNRSDAERDLFPPLPQVPNVLRAMSLVPDAVRSLDEQSGAYYLPVLDVADPSAGGDRAISRQQIELLAGRISLLNECFY